ncbi:hypothetical protein Tco_1398690 [Tanacetum coccineum]
MLRVYPLVATYEDQTDMSADMSVRGTRWQDTSIRAILLFNSFCYDDDDDDDEEYTIAIAPVLLTEEPDNSLSMGDEHLSTIPETKSDELIKFSVENLVPIPSESEDLSDIESECDVPVCDDFTTFSNPLFDTDDDDDFSSSDDESFSDEDVPKEIYSNPLFDKEIISTKIDPHHFNAESDPIESLLNRDILIVSSPKFDYLLENDRLIPLMSDIFQAIAPLRFSKTCKSN